MIQANHSAFRILQWIRFPLFVWTACHTVLWSVLFLFALAPSAATAQTAPVELLGHFDVGTTYNDVWGYTAPDGTELAIIGTITSTIYVDVSDPANPVMVAEVPGVSSIWRDIKTYGHYAYTVNDEDGGLQIVDLEDPRHPRFVANIDQFFSNSHNVYIDEEAGVLYAVGTNRGMVLLDLTQDPESPAHIANFNEFYIHDVYVRDGRAYAAAINVGRLAILDVSNLPLVQVMGSIHYPGAMTHNTWLTDDGRYCVTTDETSGGHIRIFDVSDPSNPIEVGGWTHPETPFSSVHNVLIKDDYAYIAWYVNGLEILDLTDPTQPTRVGSYDTYPGSAGLYEGAWGVYPFAQSGNIYVSDISTGLYVFAFEGNSCHLGGTVFDAETGEPLPGAELRIDALQRTLLSGNDGEFSLRVPPGEHLLAASLFGYDTFTQSVSLELGESLEIAVPLTSLPRGAVSGQVRTDAGSPVTNAVVKLLDTPLAANLEADGSFHLDAVPTGSYDVVVEATGIHGFGATVQVTEGTSSVVDLTVYPSLAIDEMESDTGWIVGAPGDAATGGIWDLGDPHGTEEGTVQPEEDHTPHGTMAWVTGNAGPGAAVGDDDVDEGGTTLTSPRYDLSGHADVLFSYYRWFTNDTAGNGGVDPFVVSASNDDGATWVELERIAQSAAEWVRVQIPLGKRLDLTSQMRFRFFTTDIAGGSIVEAAVDDLELAVSLGRIAGRVVDAQSGDPIEDASIELQVGEATTTLHSDEAGRFTFVSEGDSVQAVVRASSYQEFRTVVELGSFETTDLTVELLRRPTLSVSGVVVANGGGVAQAKVRLIDTEFETSTDDSGRFTIPGVPVGVYRIAAEKQDFVGEPMEVEISEEGGELTLELEPVFTTDLEAAFPNPFHDSTSLSYRLARPARVRVTIFDPSGREIRVLVDEDQSVGSHSFAWNGRDGEGRRLAQGLYFQRFEADGKTEVQRLVILR